MTQNKPQTVSIIGAGIMGLMCAYTLIRKAPDTKISIYDPAGFPAENASFIAGGMLAPYCELDHMPREYVAPGLKSIEIWEQISKNAPDSFEFSNKGSLVISHDQDRYMLERYKTMLPTENVWTHIAKPELNDLEPHLTSRFSHGLFVKDEAHLHPKKTMKVLCDKLAKTCDLIKQEAQPHDLNTDIIIDSRGFGAHKTQKNLRGVKGEILLVRNPEFSLSRPVRLMHPRYPLYIVPRHDNIFMIGATIVETADDNVNMRSGLELMSALYSLHPSFSEAEILQIQAGIRPAYPDNLPAITKNGNIISANGLFRHGYLLSPAMAECVSDMIFEQENRFSHLFVKESHDEDHFERIRA